MDVKMELLYYEDLKPGQILKSSQGYLLTEENIIDYARQWDPEPFHLDPEMGKKTPFGGLIASGFHLLSVMRKLSAEAPLRAAMVAGLGLKEIRFEVAARPGDTLILEQRILAKRNSKQMAHAGLVREEVRQRVLRLRLRNRWISGDFGGLGGVPQIQKSPLDGLT